MYIIFYLCIWTELLERVFLCLGSASTDEQLKDSLQKFLVPTILKSDSHFKSVQDKVIDGHKSWSSQTIEMCVLGVDEVDTILVKEGIIIVFFFKEICWNGPPIKLPYSHMTNGIV